MLSPTHLLGDIRQQTADLAQSLSLYQRHYGPLPIDSLTAALLTTLLAHLPDSPMAPTDTRHRGTPEKPNPGEQSFTDYLLKQSQIAHDGGQYALASHYRNARNIFLQHLDGEDITLGGLTPQHIKAFEVWLLNDRGVSRNTSSFYMRQLRAIYNRAVREGLTPDRQPFAGVYTGVDRTNHRALALPQLKQLTHLDLSRRPELQQARDLFLFSYYTRGMSFIDMAYLRTSDLAHGQLTYTRRKTHQTLTLQWEPEMQRLLTRLIPLETLKPETLKPETPNSYLLPILTTAASNGEATYKAYRRYSQHLNARLHQLGQMLHLPIPLTMYVARHTWASIAYHRGTPVSIIGQGLGHSGTSERTTSIYLASMNHQVIDRANRALLNAIR